MVGNGIGISNIALFCIVGLSDREHVCVQYCEQTTGLLQVGSCVESSLYVASAVSMSMLTLSATVQCTVQMDLCDVAIKDAVVLRLLHLMGLFTAFHI